jgi:N-acetylneuraminic acid mutarotase
MRRGRGCFSACYHDEFIYVFGGINTEEDILNSCEKYDIENDIWYTIKDLSIPRKNSSVCPLTSDSIYIFGGTREDGRMTDTIEMYLLSADLWITLNVKLPSPISFSTAFKVTQYSIILLGGLIEADSESTETYPTNQVI